jgi:hypothetical protein
LSYPTFEETTARAIEACEAAWAFFGGIFKVLKSVAALESDRFRSEPCKFNLFNLRVPPQPIQYVANGVPLRNRFVRNRYTKLLFEGHPDLDAIEAVRVQFFKRGRIREIPVKAR